MKKTELTGKACFAIMIISIWICCTIVALNTGDVEALSIASQITLVCGLGYVLLN